MVEGLTEKLKGLSDETRLRILNLLYEQDLCVCDVMDILQISQAKASRHLIYLKNVGLLNDRKYIRWVYYSVARNVQLKFIDTLIYDNLRGLEPYKSDLEKQKHWSKYRKQSCAYLEL